MGLSYEAIRASTGADSCGPTQACSSSRTPLVGRVQHQRVILKGKPIAKRKTCGPCRFSNCRVVRCAKGEPGGFSNSDFEKIVGRAQKLREKEVDDDMVSAYNWRKGRCVQKTLVVVEGSGSVRKVKLCEEAVAFGTTTGVCYVVNIETGAMLARLEGMQSEVTSLDFDGHHVVAGGKEGEVWMWDAHTQEGMMICKHREPCLSVQMHEAGSVISADTAGEVRRSTVSKSTVSKSEICAQASQPLGCLQVSDSGAHAIAGLADGGIVVWTTADFQPIMSFQAHDAPVTCVQMVWDDALMQQVLLTGAADGTVKSWDFNGGKALRTFAGHRAAVTCVQFDGTKVVSGARDSSIRVWDLRSGKSLFGLFGYTVYLGSVQYNRTVLISDGTNNVVSMYDFAEGSDYIQDSEDDFHFDDLDC